MNDLFCTNCGSRLEPGSAFCDNCGEPVEPDATLGASMSPSQGASAYQNGPAGGQPKKKGKKWPIVLVASIIAIVIIIVVVAAGQDGDSKKGEGDATEQAQEQSSSSSAAGSSSAASAATTTPVNGAPVFPYIETSSVLAPDSTTSDYGGYNVADGIIETAWNEGASGDGTGEWIEFYASSPQHVSSVSIMGGYPKPYRDGSDVYYKNNRPRQITISYDGGSQAFLLQDLRSQFQICEFPQPVDTTFIRITIDSVYKGANYDDCCIAEVKVS